MACKRSPVRLRPSIRSGSSGFYSGPKCRVSAESLELAVPV